MAMSIISPHRDTGVMVCNGKVELDEYGLYYIVHLPDRSEKLDNASEAWKLIHSNSPQNIDPNKLDVNESDTSLKISPKLDKVHDSCGFPLPEVELYYGKTSKVVILHSVVMHGWKNQSGKGLCINLVTSAFDIAKKKDWFSLAQRVDLMFVAVPNVAGCICYLESFWFTLIDHTKTLQLTTSFTTHCFEKFSEIRSWCTTNPPSFGEWKLEAIDKKQKCSFM